MRAAKAKRKRRGTSAVCPCCNCLSPDHEFHIGRWVKAGAAIGRVNGYRDDRARPEVFVRWHSVAGGVIFSPSDVESVPVDRLVLYVPTGPDACRHCGSPKGMAPGPMCLAHPDPWSPPEGAGT